MPISNEWYIPKRILLTRMSGHMSIDEMVTEVSNGTSMIDSGDAPVYSLVDVSDVKSFPLALSDYNRVWDSGTSDKLSLIVVYGIQNRLMNLLASIFAKLIKRNYIVAPDLQGALKLLNERDGTPFATTQSASVSQP